MSSRRPNSGMRRRLPSRRRSRREADRDSGDSGLLSSDARRRAAHAGPQGRASSDEPLAAERTALVIIDMQNHFVAEGGAGEVPPARSIVGASNGLATEMRARAVPVVWIQTTASRALELWPQHHSSVLTPERAQRRLASLAEQSWGFAIYRELAVEPFDLRLTKVHYSAFIPGSSRLHEELHARGIDTILVAGTATNVCCESTGRDAMMMNYRVVM